MQHKPSVFPVLFSLVLMVFVVFLIWYIPSVEARKFQLEDLGKSLETSQGRERKQQYEYDQTVAEIPEVQEKLDLLIPESEAAQQEVDQLKQERKQLREEKKRLEALLSEQPAEEDAHE